MSSSAADDMRAAEQQVQLALPIKSTARSVSLMIELSTSRWERNTAFPLAPPDNLLPAGDL